MIITTIGLGKLGYPMAEFLSSSGSTVKVYDKNESYIKKLSSNKIEFYENGLSKYKDNGNKLIFCDSISEAITHSSIIFITVPTPSKKSGDFSNEFILNVLKDISKSLKKSKNKKPVIININSTVSPGSFENEFVPFMTNEGLKINEDYCFVYNPYFVALGNVINNLENPDMVLVGTSSIYAAKTMNKFYQSIYDHPNIKMMSLQEAEITKLSLNAYLTLKISYSNSLVNSVKENPNIDPNRILDAIGSDKRVGKKFIMPGGPFAGPCLPRDTYALKNHFETTKSSSVLLDTINKINEDTLNTIFRDFKKLNSKYGFKKFGFLGLGYRPNTSNIEDSFALKLFDLCNGEGFEVAYLDHYLDHGLRKNQLFDEKDLVGFSDVLFLSYIDFKNKNLLNEDLYKKTILWDIWYQFKEFKSKNIIHTVSSIDREFVKDLNSTESRSLRVVK